jgi:endoglucanase
MNDDQFEFFRTLVESTGPSGYEAAVQSVWRARVEGAADSLSTDVLGNCIAVINAGGTPSVMLDAHIDEIGFIVKFIDDDGFLYFSTIGGFDAATLPGNRVIIKGRNGDVRGVIGRKPRHLMTEDDKKKAPEIKSMWIDIGVRNRADAESLVSVGDGGGRDHGVQRLNGNVITSSTLDDRVGSYVVAETFRAVARSRSTAEIQAVSSTQEEIGLRGARVSAYRSRADIGIAVEVTWTSDHPHAAKTELGDIRVGAGPAIFRGPNINPRVFDRMVSAAEAEGIPYQLDIYATGSPTDGHVMQMSRNGMAVGIVSVPTRYLHTASEVLSLDDVDATVALLTRFTAELQGGIDLTP